MLSRSSGPRAPPHQPGEAEQAERGGGGFGHGDEEEVGGSPAAGGAAAVVHGCRQHRAGSSEAGLQEAEAGVGGERCGAGAEAIVERLEAAADEGTDEVVGVGGEGQRAAEFGVAVAEDQVVGAGDGGGGEQRAARGPDANPAPGREAVEADVLNAQVGDCWSNAPMLIN